jgi:hypothetical protein
MPPTLQQTLTRTLAAWVLAGCSEAVTELPITDAGRDVAADSAAGPPPMSGGDLGGDLGPGGGCTFVDESAAVQLGVSGAADDYALTLTAASQSATSWGEAGNEALVLEVSTPTRGLVGHLVLHQGRATFAYGMHLGALPAGEPVTARVSTLSAPRAVRRACVGPAQLTRSVQLGGDAEGLTHAPSFRWPVDKRFNDLPVVLGWSKSKQAYQAVFTNEDGGTVAQCGGGAAGIQAEVARWGRAHDIEGSYTYGGAAPRWGRCTGSVAVSASPLRVEGLHPVFYYGDGHNRLFESRGGYGQTCGTGGAEQSNGDLPGWNVSNPSNDLAADEGRVVILRPLPVALDPLGYGSFSGRREALADRAAPWLYRLTSLELSREGKLDGQRALPLDRYLYVDVRVADVGGSGDPYCALLGVSSGFKLRAVTRAGAQLDSSQLTADYVTGHNWKRLAIPLPAGTGAADIDHFIFDAYDGDGIYLTGLGDAFVPRAAGDNGATLDYVRKGERALTDYVDDNSSGCTGGTNSAGPGGAPYACVGGQVTLPR